MDAGIYTIGHSNHSAEQFVALLRQHGIRALVDVRSDPTSAYCPQFDCMPLERDLRAAGIRYVFLGAKLGGRPRGSGFYDARGYVLYDKVAESAAFSAGIEELRALGGRQRTVILCSEEDPAACHRHLLVGRVLVQQGVPVVHIRGDGSLEPWDAVHHANDTDPRQLKLFDDRDTGSWKSTRSVLPRRRQNSSSAR